MLLLTGRPRLFMRAVEVGGDISPTLVMMGWGEGGGGVLCFERSKVPGGNAHTKAPTASEATVVFLIVLAFAQQCP